MASFNFKQAVVMAVFATAFARLSPGNIEPAENNTPANGYSPEVRRSGEPPLEIEPLRDWRPRPVALPHQIRNVFAFGRAVPKHDIGDYPRAGGAPAQIIPPLPPPPLFRLVGMAEETGPDGSIRTAIISGDGGLFVVTDGDAVTSRYRVASVSPDTVDLTDLQSGSTLTLAFK